MRERRTATGPGNVGWRALRRLIHSLLGPYTAAQPSNGKELLSVSGVPRLLSWEQFLGNSSRQARLTFPCAGGTRLAP